MSLPSTANFTPEEMRCRDGTPYPEEWDVRLAVLFDAWQTIRSDLGWPIEVVSGYRTPEHNAGRGVQGSQHVEGRAIDGRPRPPGRAVTKADVLALAAVVNKLLKAGKLPAVGGVGVYPLVLNKRTKLWEPGWVHVDTRPKPASGHIARWVGEGFGAELTA